MSANNWQFCPKCKKNKENQKKKHFVDIKAKYGKEYERLLNIKPEEDDQLQETLREDYEIGLTEDGEFYVSYTGSCQHCGFKHSFKHKEQLKL